jgi:hypothetical protein
MSNFLKLYVYQMLLIYGTLILYFTFYNRHILCRCRAVLCKYGTFCAGVCTRVMYNYVQLCIIM